MPIQDRQSETHQVVILDLGTTGSLSFTLPEDLEQIEAWLSEYRLHRTSLADFALSQGWTISHRRGLLRRIWDRLTG
ncbi:hypothetical protein [Nocardia brasiliensis]|uniref:hypothetical protein n=1 Tax=Nocardia brasiliensis TaxID=37326 RepID=UPI002458F051|nr:hypothetical protein [Nocardia brasiliensis]